MRKICVVVTARPSYSRIKTALQAIKDHPELKLELVVAASALLNRYGAVVNTIQDDGFEIAARVQMVLEGENPTTMAKTTGIGVMELATVFDNLRPDMVVSIADRYETLATAVAAAYMNIPLVHVQGGEVTGSIDEKVRHAVTKLADIHLVATDSAANRVIKLGENPTSVFVTGCPSIDLARDLARSERHRIDPFEEYGSVGNLTKMADDYLVVLQHPVTTEYGKARDQAFATLEAVDATGMPALWFWPNVDAGSDGTSNAIRTFRETENPEKIAFIKGMQPYDFLQLLNAAKCLVGNSSVGIRECSFLGVPVVNIGSRQSGRDKGKNVIDCDYGTEEIYTAISKQIARSKRFDEDLLYGDGHSGGRIANILVDAPLSIDKKLTY